MIGRRHVAITLLAALLGATGCAEVGPPPGGPPDTTPPYVLSSSPDSLETGVDSAAVVSITFSEAVDRRSAREWLFVNPYRPIASAKWDGPTLKLRFQNGLPPDTTMQVFLGSGVKDRAGLPLSPPFSRLFTRGSEISPGRVQGRIRTSRLVTAPADTARGRTTTAPPKITRVPSTARFVWLFALRADTIPDPIVEVPDWVGEVDPTGSYRLDGVPLDVPYRIMALYDADRSRGPTGSADYWSFQPDTLMLTVDRPQRLGFDLWLIDPKSPGQVTGRIEPPPDSTRVDSVGVIVFAAVRDAGADSSSLLWPPTRITRSARPLADGSWLLKPLPPGHYRIGACRDKNANFSPDPGEVVGPPVEVEVKADEEVSNVTVVAPPGG